MSLSPFKCKWNSKKPMPMFFYSVAKEKYSWEYPDSSGGAYLLLVFWLLGFFLAVLQCFWQRSYGWGPRLPARRSSAWWRWGWGWWRSDDWWADGTPHGSCVTDRGQTDNSVWEWTMWQCKRPQAVSIDDVYVALYCMHTKTSAVYHKHTRSE